MLLELQNSWQKGLEQLFIRIEFDDSRYGDRALGTSMFWPDSFVIKAASESNNTGGNDRGSSSSPVVVGTIQDPVMVTNSKDLEATAAG